MLHLPFQLPAAHPGQCGETLVEPELTALVTDEVQRGQHGLTGHHPQATPELLQEHRRALGRPKEQHSVDRGNVEALVEQVDGEDDVDRAVAQRAQRVLPVRRGGARLDRAGRDPGRGEPIGHVSGMGGADAEPEGPHLSGVGHLVPDLAQHDPGSRVVAGVQRVQRGDVVAPAGPGDRGEIGSVVDAEVVEGTQQVLVEGVPQPQLGGGPAVEERPDVDPVATLGSRGQAEQLDRGEAVQQPAVARGLGVVELVDDHDVEPPWVK